MERPFTIQATQIITPALFEECASCPELVQKIQSALARRMAGFPTKISQIAIECLDEKVIIMSSAIIGSYESHGCVTHFASFDMPNEAYCPHRYAFFLKRD